MKIKNLVLLLVASSLILTACQQAQEVIPTDTIVPTVAIVPTDTPEPAPAATLEATEAVPATIGAPVSSANWELTIIDIAMLEGNVYDPETNGYYPPSEGNRFVKVGLKVKPLASAVAVPIGNITIYDENDQPNGAYYYGTQDAVNGEIDPFTIEVKRCLTMAIIGEAIDIPSETYLHMIFQVPVSSMGQELTFRFDDVLPVAFTLE